MQAFFGSEQLVVKIGGSCFGQGEDYLASAKALEQLQRDSGARLLVVVSAAKGQTNKLIAEAKEDFPSDPWAQASAVAKGEDMSAEQLLLACRATGVAAQLISAADIDLLGWGGEDPFNGHLLGANGDKLKRVTQKALIIIIPGYYALDQKRRRRVLLGRGATDLIAVALAGALGTDCLFCKDGGAVYAFDPRWAEPGQRPKQISHLSYDQAYDFSSSGHGFLMPQSLLLAKQQGVALYFVPSPAAPDAWQIGAAISGQAAPDGIFVGVQTEAYLNAVSCVCVTVTEWGQERLNGQLASLARSAQPYAVRATSGQTKIYLSPEAVAPLVGALAKELGLLAP